jgi:hypothetical protein
MSCEQDLPPLKPDQEPTSPVSMTAMTDVPSSPPSAMPETIGSRRVTAAPNITPNRFRRFFTPRSSVRQRIKTDTAARRALEDITRPGNVVNSRSHPRETFEPFADIDENKEVGTIENGRKRRCLPTPPNTSPLRPHEQSPVQLCGQLNVEWSEDETDIHSSSQELQTDHNEGGVTDNVPHTPSSRSRRKDSLLRRQLFAINDDESRDRGDDVVKPLQFVTPIRRPGLPSINGRLLDRGLGNNLGRHKLRNARHCAGEFLSSYEFNHR